VSQLESVQCTLVFEANRRAGIRTQRKGKVRTRRNWVIEEKGKVTNTHLVQMREGGILGLEECTTRGRPAGTKIGVGWVGGGRTP